MGLFWGETLGISIQMTDMLYEIYNQAVVSPNNSWGGEVTAPDGIIENGKMRLWYHGVETPLYWPWVIGYSEADYPLNW